MFTPQERAAHLLAALAKIDAGEKLMATGYHEYVEGYNPLSVAAYLLDGNGNAQLSLDVGVGPGTVCGLAVRRMRYFRLDPVLLQARTVGTLDQPLRAALAAAIRSQVR
jgi:hypothetical protein